MFSNSDEYQMKSKIIDTHNASMCHLQLFNCLNFCVPVNENCQAHMIDGREGRQPKIGDYVKSSLCSKEDEMNMKNREADYSF